MKGKRQPPVQDTRFHCTGMAAGWQMAAEQQIWLCVQDASSGVAAQASMVGALRRVPEP